VRGGTDKGVEYFVFPGSGDGTLLSNDEIARRGAALIAQRPKNQIGNNAPANAPPAEGEGLLKAMSKE